MIVPALGRLSFAECSCLWDVLAIVRRIEPRDINRCECFDIPSLDTVNLQIHPPYARDAQHQPQHPILQSPTHGNPFENAEVE